MQAYHAGDTDEVTRPQGPNVNKLIVRIMARDAIPKNGGLMDGIRFLTDKDRLMATARSATIEAFDYIDAVKSARGNPWGDDEAIAAAIIKQIEAKEGTYGRLP